MAWSEADAVAEVRGSLEQAIAGWARGLEQGDMFTYLEAYDDSFRHWGMNKDEWSAFSMETVGHRPISRVEVSDLLLLGDPQPLPIEDRGGRGTQRDYRTPNILAPLRERRLSNRCRG
jgi:hypothetical protein